ncbi:hypothetical protein ID866_9682 [Astraeus odoratus]|nr:hypothetical protein ID866_9682 [Astraeus odoratus]
MIQLEQEMAKMTTTMCHWQDNFVTSYLVLNDHANRGLSTSKPFFSYEHFANMS